MNEEQQAEWNAWQDVVKDWRKIVGDINDPKYTPLVRSIQVWGEYLVALREDQGDAEKARDDADAAWIVAHPQPAGV